MMTRVWIVIYTCTTGFLGSVDCPGAQKKHYQTHDECMAAIAAAPDVKTIMCIEGYMRDEKK